MLSYLNDFKDVLDHGEPEKKKDFIKMFVKSILMHPDKKEAKIALYKRPLPDIIMENRSCVETEEIIYQN